jgi:hypothetical protein
VLSCFVEIIELCENAPEDEFLVLLVRLLPIPR